MTSTFEIKNFRKIDRRKQKLLNSKPWRGQMKFLNNAGYQSTVGSLLKNALLFVFMCINTNLKGKCSVQMNSFHLIL